MIEQVLQISVTPMQYELDVQNAKLQYHQEFRPEADVKTTQGVMQMQKKDIQVKLDTSEARKSLGFRTTGQICEEGAQKGEDHIKELTRSYVDMGQQMSHIEQGNTIPNIIKQKVIQEASQSSQMYTVFLPSSGADISWQPGSLKMQYKPGEAKYDWKIQDSQFDYVPGSVHLNILQHAKVNIQYIGGPLYFPPSSDPEYVDKEVG